MMKLSLLSFSDNAIVIDQPLMPIYIDYLVIVSLRNTGAQRNEL